MDTACRSKGAKTAALVGTLALSLAMTACGANSEGRTTQSKGASPSDISSASGNTKDVKGCDKVVEVFTENSEALTQDDPTLEESITTYESVIPKFEALAEDLPHGDLKDTITGLTAQMTTYLSAMQARAESPDPSAEIPESIEDDLITNITQYGQNLVDLCPESQSIPQSDADT